MMAAAAEANANLAAAQRMQAQLLAGEEVTPERVQPEVVVAATKKVDWDSSSFATTPESGRQRVGVTKPPAGAKGPLMVQLPTSVQLSSKPPGRVAQVAADVAPMQARVSPAQQQQQQRARVEERSMLQSSQGECCTYMNNHIGIGAGE